MKIHRLLLGVLVLVTATLAQTTSVSTGSIVTVDSLLNIVSTMASMCNFGSSVGTLNGREYSYVYDVSAQTTTTTVVILPVTYRKFTLTWYFRFTDSLDATGFSVDFSGLDISNVEAVVNLQEGAFIATYQVTLPTSTFVTSLASYCIAEWVSFSFTRPTDANPAVNEFYTVYTGDLGSTLINLISSLTCGAVTIANCPIYSAGMDFDCTGFSSSGSCTSTVVISQSFSPPTSSSSTSSTPELPSSSPTLSFASSSEISSESESSVPSSVTSSVRSSMSSSPSISSTPESSSDASLPSSSVEPSSTTSTSESSTTSSASYFSTESSSSLPKSSTTSSFPSSVSQSSSTSSVSSSISEGSSTSSTTTSTPIDEGTIVTVTTPLDIETTVSSLSAFGSSTGTLNGKEYSYIYDISATTLTGSVGPLPVAYRQFTVTWYFKFSDSLDASDFDVYYSGLDIEEPETVVNLEEGAFISTYIVHVPVDTFLVSIGTFCLEEWMSFTFTVTGADSGDNEFYTLYTGNLVSGVIDTIESIICGIVTLDDCPIHISRMDFDCSGLNVDGPSTSALVIDQEFSSSVSSSSQESSSVSSASQESSVISAPVSTGSITTVDAPLDVKTTISSLAQFGSSIGTINGKEYSYIYDVSAETLTGTVLVVPITYRQFTVTWYFEFTDPLNAVDFTIDYSGLDIADVEAVVNLEEGAFISTYIIHTPALTFAASLTNFCLDEWIAFTFTVPDTTTGDDEIYTLYTGDLVTSIVSFIESVVCEVVVIGNCPIHMDGMDFDCSDLSLNGPSTSTLIIDEEFSTSSVSDSSSTSSESSESGSLSNSNSGASSPEGNVGNTLGTSSGLPGLLVMILMALF